MELLEKPNSDIIVSAQKEMKQAPLIISNVLNTVSVVTHKAHDSYVYVCECTAE